MNPGDLIGSLLEGTLLGGRRPGGRALRFLTHGKGSFLNASTLLTAAGVAWGLLESVLPKTTVGSSSGLPGSVSPPLPTGPPPPPKSERVLVPEGISPEVLRLIRLSISAAHADGVLAPQENNAILAKAREFGVEGAVQFELETPTALSEIVAGVTDPRQKEDMYTLAFAIAHADEGVTGTEKIYLAQLANLLGHDPGTTARLEQSAAAQIQNQH